MTSSLKYIVPVVLLIAAVFMAFTMNTQAEVYSNSCTVSTSTSRIVGNASSQTVLGTSTTRAWATIQVNTNETNIVFLSFAQGANAVVNTGFALGTSTEDENDIEFGRNTEFPYTGIVTGITNTSSTTVLVTECNY